MFNYIYIYLLIAFMSLIELLINSITAFFPSGNNLACFIISDSNHGDKIAPSIDQPDIQSMKVLKSPFRGKRDHNVMLI